jgi:hypothetical protein
MSKPEPPLAVLHNFPRHAVLIAELIAEWSLIEDGCSQLFARFTKLELDQASLILASIISSGARLDVLKTAGDYFFKRFDQSHLETFDGLCKAMRQRLRIRNTYAHGLFFADNGELVILKRKFAADDPSGRHVVYEKQLVTELQNMIDVLRRLIEFSILVWKLPITWQ